jgi:hypothetical protein
MNDILCRFEVMDTMGSLYLQYAFVTACSARSGTNQAQQVFVCLHPIDWDVELQNEMQNKSGLCDMVLDLQALTYFDFGDSGHFPRQPTSAGRLRMFTSDQFAAFLLDLPVKIDSTLDAVQVTAHLIHYKDILPSRVVLIGANESFGAMIASPETSPAISGEGDQDEADDPADDQGEGGQGEESQEFDLLSYLEMTRASEPKPKRKKTQQGKKQETTKECNDDHKRNDPILDDPSLSTFLSQHDIAALKSARDQCQMMTGEVHEWIAGEGVGSGESECDFEDVATLHETSDDAPAAGSTSSSSRARPSDSCYCYL